MSETLLSETQFAEETRGLARNASIIALGNIASRVLGLARDTVKSHYFGATGAVSAYELAVIVPVTLYDLLIGGMVSSALVPVFSGYLARQQKEELWQLVGTLLAVLTIVMAVFIGMIQLDALACEAFMAVDCAQE